MRRGAFIVFEGLDRSGKSTQSRLLHEALKQKAVPSELWQYPNRSTSIGDLISKYLKKQIELDDTAVHLLFSANRWETVKDLKAKLNVGATLIVDRYAYSGVAYTASKDGFDLDWCKTCDNGLPKPDLLFFLDSRNANLASRDEFGAERYETCEFQSKVYTNFKRLLNYESPESYCRIINAKNSIENIHAEILSATMELLKSDKLLNDPSVLW